MPRVLYRLVHPPPSGDLYTALSINVLRHGSLGFDGQRTAQFEPVYPMFLAAARAVVPNVLVVDLLQTLVAAFGALFLYRLAAALTADNRVATLAAMLYAAHPLLIREAVGRSESALFTTMLIAFAAAFVEKPSVRTAAVAGAWLGVSALTRTTALPLIVLAPGILVVRRSYRAALTLFIVALVVFLPLPVRNQSLNGAWLPTRGGINLFIGNSPATSALLPEYDLDLLQRDAAELIDRTPDVRDLPAPAAERAVDALLTREAIAYMAADPVRTLKAKVLNLWYLFSPWPVPYQTVTSETELVSLPSGAVAVRNAQRRAPAEVLTFAVFSSLLLVCAAAGVYLRRRDLGADAILWAIALTVAVVNVVYVPATRYRAPMEFSLVFYAAISIAAFARRLGGR